ncbi:hypothetical protein HQ590_14755 [bacterium]|nr:hypothetical protein [bacterium]
MNKDFLAAKWVGAIALLVVLAMSECATAGYQRAGLTRVAVADTRAVVARTDAGVGAVSMDLDALQDQHRPDLRPVFSRYVERVHRLQADRRLIAHYNNRLQDRADVYFHAWERELDSFSGAGVRENSFQRRRTAEESVGRVQLQFTATDESLGSLLRQLGDLERLLANDLTIAGVGSGRAAMDQIRQQAVQTRRQLHSLQTELNRIDTELAPGQTTPEMQPNEP